jgi:transposase
LVGYPWDPLPRRFNESRAVDKNKQTHISAVLKYSLSARYRHVALRLPPYHQELNPIEKMWAMVKNWVAMKNVTYQLQDVRKLAEEKFSSITKDEWLPVCKHDKKWRRNTYKMNTWSTTLPRNWLSSFSHLIQT